ncbi:MAG: hypothetical protein EA001_15820 [Oscillatoriales cyanobacterium]|nr:MAG: hypothetical protein EA001_15820 [Oscillatoriales cyanobacterium]
MDGLYTLANDVVLEQVLALLNSIEANAGRRADGSPDPVIICPYDDWLDRLWATIADRPHVQLWDDPAESRMGIAHLCLWLIHC